jgi:opacity protein-like surface antigen
VRPRWQAIGLLVVLLLAAAPTAVRAQTVEVAPFGGYRFGGDLYEVYTGTPLDIDGGPTLGGLFDVFVDPGLSVTFLYAHQQADLQGEVRPGVEVTWPTVAVDHWHVGGTQAFGRGKVQPLLTGTLGLTRFGSAGDSEIRFSMAAGGGVKLMPTRHLGVRLDGRVYAVIADAATIGGCAQRCLIGVDASLVWQAEFTAGVVFSF